MSVTKKVSKTQMDPELLKYLVEKIEALFPACPKRILLFGSRGRVDHTPRSDYDLAFDLPDAERSEWARFAVDSREDAPTLHGLDLIWLQDCPNSLYDQIMKEGIIIYESEISTEI